MIYPQGPRPNRMPNTPDLVLEHATIVRVQDTVAIALNSCRSGAHCAHARSWVATAGREGREPQTKLAKAYKAYRMQLDSMPQSTCTGMATVYFRQDASARRPAVLIRAPSTLPR